ISLSGSNVHAPFDGEPTCSTAEQAARRRWRARMFMNVRSDGVGSASPRVAVTGRNGARAFGAMESRTFIGRLKAQTRCCRTAFFVRQGYSAAAGSAYDRAG